MGMLAKRKTKRAMAPLKISTTLGAEALHVIAMSAGRQHERAGGKSNFGKLRKNVAARALVTGGPPANLTYLHICEWHSLKEKVTTDGFVIQFSWTNSDPGEPGTVTIVTTDAVTLGDGIIWPREHDNVRRWLMEGVLSTDPNARVMEAI